MFATTITLLKSSEKTLNLSLSFNIRNVLSCLSIPETCLVASNPHSTVRAVAAATLPRVQGAPLPFGNALGVVSTQGGVDNDGEERAPLQDQWLSRGWMRPP
jgi:hypothetical protein